MSKIRLTLSCWEYDRTRALQEGKVQVEGVDLTYLPLHVEETFWRMLRYGEFDAAECSLSSYIMSRERGYPRLIAIPVFPSRFFRHAFIFVNTECGIEKPKDLIGKRVGVPEYQITAAVWIRGILQHDYGVAPEKLKWFTGGAEDAGREEKLKPDLAKDIDIRWIGPDRTLTSMLEQGELDALICAHIPSPFVRRSPKVRRLFPDFREVEKEYYRRTKIFPIMHTIVLREEVYEKYPWLAQSLCKAFAESKRICEESLYKYSALKYMLPWSYADVEEQWELFGDEFWPYGLESNRHVLETLVQYSHEQGLIKKLLDVKSLFAPNSLEEFKV
jgi:4,5-dihydroxyphthalate decarboxylase